jgi:dTMP kinase
VSAHRSGRFITLEGIEGAGKSTVAQYIRDWLSARGVSVCLTREPGGTALAERVRNIVLERGSEKLTPVTETLLMFAARGIHIETLLRPALERGAWVVCDRFSDATRAYQAGGRGVRGELIEELVRAVHPTLTPDCTLLLDLPVDVGIARAKARSGSLPTDRFEAEPAVFFERVRAAYLELAKREPQRFQIIDASAPLAAVEKAVAAVIEPMLDPT